MDQDAAMLLIPTEPSFIKRLDEDKGQMQFYVSGLSELYLYRTCFWVSALSLSCSLGIRRANGSAANHVTIASPATYGWTEVYK